MHTLNDLIWSSDTNEVRAGLLIAHAINKKRARETTVVKDVAAYTKRAANAIGALEGEYEDRNVVLEDLREIFGMRMKRAPHTGRK
jgi:hypothetical protein